MKPPQFPKMREGHKRGASTTLLLLDEALCQFEQWAEGREIVSVLYREQNDLSARQRRSILSEIAKMRKVLEELREALGLEAETEAVAHLIRSRCSVMWEYLVELEGKRLRRYGELLPGLAEYLDGRVAELTVRLGRILDASRGDTVRKVSGAKRQPPSE